MNSEKTNIDNSEDKLGISYYLLGKQMMPIEINRKTGLYLTELDQTQAYSFARENSEIEDIFRVTGVNFESNIDLKEGDRVSICLFGSGALFLAYNHRSKKHHYYPEAVKDQYYSNKEALKSIFTGMFSEYRLFKSLDKEAKSFPNSDTYKDILVRVASL